MGGTGQRTPSFPVAEITGTPVAAGSDGGTNVDSTADADAATSLLRNPWGGGNGGEDATFEDGGREISGGAADKEVEREDAEAVRKNPRFGWASYRQAFPDTPPHAAITALVAEYALLVGSITSHLSAAVGAPMTLQEGVKIVAQAQTFVLRYATPIFGPLHTTKVHKLLVA